MVGIYKIENTENGKIYVGQSVTVESRLRNHRNALLGNYHHNADLQKDFNKFGEDSFSFEILEEVEIITDTSLGERETYWCEVYNSIEVGYNIQSPQSSYSLAYSEDLIIEIREKYASGEYHQKDLSVEYEITLSTICQIVTGKMYSHYGGPLTKGGNGKPYTSSGPLTENDVIEIKNLLENGISSTKISKKFDINTHTVANIKYGVHWSHIPGKIWEKVELRSSAKLDDDMILSIRKYYDPQIHTYLNVVDKFGIPKNYVSDIVRGKIKPELGGETYTKEEIKAGNRKRLRPLNDEVVRKIKIEINSNNKTYTEIAKRYGISQTTLSHIANEETYKDVKPDIIKSRKKVNQKLKEEEVIAIKVLLVQSSLTYKEIASRFNIASGQIRKIKNEKCWKGVGPKTKHLDRSGFLKNINMKDINRAAHAKLSVEEVSEIKFLLNNSNLNQKQIASIYPQVCRNSVSSINIGRTWQDINSLENINKTRLKKLKKLFPDLKISKLL